MNSKKSVQGFFDWNELPSTAIEVIAEFLPRKQPEKDLWASFGGPDVFFSTSQYLQVITVCKALYKMRSFFLRQVSIRNAKVARKFLHAGGSPKIGVCDTFYLFEIILRFSLRPGWRFKVDEPALTTENLHLLEVIRCVRILASLESTRNGLGNEVAVHLNLYPLRFCTEFALSDVSSLYNFPSSSFEHFSRLKKLRLSSSSCGSPFGQGGWPSTNQQKVDLSPLADTLTTLSLSLKSRYEIFCSESIATLTNLTDLYLSDQEFPNGIEALALVPLTSLALHYVWLPSNAFHSLPLSLVKLVAEYIHTIPRDANAIVTFPNTLSNLEVLRIVYECDGPNWCGGPNCIGSLQPLSNLRCLELIGTHDEMRSQLHISSLTRLETLRFNTGEFFGFGSVIDPLPSSLKKLAFIDCEGRGLFQDCDESLRLDELELCEPEDFGDGVLFGGVYDVLRDCHVKKLALWCTNEYFEITDAPPWCEIVDRDHRGSDFDKTPTWRSDSE